MVIQKEVFSEIESSDDEDFDVAELDDLCDGLESFQD